MKTRVRIDRSLRTARIGRAPLKSAALAALFLTIFAPSLLGADAAEILRQVDIFRNPLDSFVIDVQVVSHRKDETETATFKVYGQGLDKSLVEFVSPASDKGRYLLMLRDAMWIYMPNTRKPIRISPLQRLMGEASNGDVARTNYTIDYLPEMAGEDVVDGAPAYVLELKAKDNDLSYSRVKLWVSKKNYEPIQADFFVVSGMHMKRAFFRTFGIMNGRRTVTGMEIHDIRQKGLWTELKYSGLQPKKLSEKLFNKNYLGKW
ncbi:MAG: outer membrane lipoprotein-sorting protein [Acidobacteria bacterium]|nr:MAG: outer membrane lipoprotein-sorting protein [Acidobacteriota bacterium]